MTTKIDLTREVKEKCSNCGHETKLIYDIFGEDLIIYCEDCYINYLAKSDIILETEEQAKDLLGTMKLINAITAITGE